MKIAIGFLFPVLFVTVLFCSRKASITQIPEGVIVDGRLALFKPPIIGQGKSGWKYDLPGGMKMELALERNDNGHWDTEKTFTFPSEHVGPSSGVIGLEYKDNAFNMESSNGLMIQTETRVPLQGWSMTFQDVGPSKPDSVHFGFMSVDPDKLGEAQTLWEFSIHVDGRNRKVLRATVRLTK
jgi:hypothetical protein